MPTYTYMCNKCNLFFNKIRGITEPDPGYTCEECGSDLARTFSGSNVGITFKGSGFYRTDK